MKIIQWIVIFFFLVGVIYPLFISPMDIIGPILFIGITYYLYRYPPQWLIRLTSSSPRPKKRRKNPFKVIPKKK